jgi:hypothetical protein
MATYADASSLYLLPSISTQIILKFYIEDPLKVAVYSLT